MLRNRSYLQEEACFFVTTSCYKMLPLLSGNEEIILENWKIYNRKFKVQLLAYIIMNNYIHFVIHFTQTNRLSDYMKDFKKYTAVEIKKKIKEGNPKLLELLIHEKNKAKHKIWQERFDDLHLYSRLVCETKLDTFISIP